MAKVELRRSGSGERRGNAEGQELRPKVFDKHFAFLPVGRPPKTRMSAGPGWAIQARVFCTRPWEHRAAGPAALLPRRAREKPADSASSSSAAISGPDGDATRDRARA